MGGGDAGNILVSLVNRQIAGRLNKVQRGLAINLVDRVLDVTEAGQGTLQRAQLWSDENVRRDQAIRRPYSEGQHREVALVVDVRQRETRECLHPDGGCRVAQAIRLEVLGPLVLYDLHDHAIGLYERLAIAGHAEQIAHEVVVLGVEWQAAAVKV